MKNYLASGINLTGDSQINPAPPETRPIGQVQRFIIHHDAELRPHDYDTVARIRRQADLHRRNGLGSFAYHYVIDNTGQIFHCRPLHFTTWHCGNYHWNQRSIGIKLDGYFHPPHNQKPTREQYEALVQLLNHLSTQMPAFPADQDDVYGHKEVGQTACPGSTFDWFPPHFRQVGGRVGVPADLVYDWPSLQPANAPTNPPPAAPPKEPQQQPEKIVVNYRVYSIEKKQLGAYKLLENAIGKWAVATDGNGFIVDSNGRDVTPKPEPPKAPQPKPADPQKPVETPKVPSRDDDQDKRLGVLESALKAIQDFINSIFKR